MSWAPNVVDNEKTIEKPDLLSIEKQICSILQKGETVKKALARIGHSIPKEARGRGRGRGKDEKGKTQKKEKHPSVVQLELLTGLAGILMNEGITDIYDYPRSKIKALIKAEEGKKGTGGESSSSSSKRQRQNEDNQNNNDQAISNVDLNQSELQQQQSTGKEYNTNTATTSNIYPSTVEGGEGGSMWEYKTSMDSNDVFGPFPAATMAAWWNSGYLQGVVVRKKRHQQTSGSTAEATEQQQQQGEEGPFVNIEQADFSS